jgi:20S proteasome subunit beta 7
MMLPSATPSRQHTTRPMVTGTSVLGIVYKDGVLLAADTLLSYGTLAKAQRISRLTAIPNTSAIVGGSGEYSDYTKLVAILTAKALEESTTSLMSDLYPSPSSSAASFSAKSIWNYLRMLMYSRRNKMNPFWNELVVAGYDPASNAPFLGSVDKIGTTVADNFVATGFGAYLAMPLLREKYRPDLSEGEARALLEDCMKVLFYRDCRASSTIQLAKCDSSGTVLVSEPYDLETSWDSPDFIRPVADLEGDGGW